jgi:CheY-like chemotaxis protein
MKVLIAEDDPVFRYALEVLLPGWGYEAVCAADGLAAWGALQAPDPPRLAVLDWTMPGLDGPEVCRRARRTPGLERTYLILVTGRSRPGDVVKGLNAGADEHVAKPIEFAELQARLNAGRRIVELQARLEERAREAEEALARVRQLQGLLPICAWCKKVRDDGDYWRQVEDYLGRHLDIRCTHGICPDCYTGVAGQLRPAETAPGQGPGSSR